LRQLLISARDFPPCIVLSGCFADNSRINPAQSKARKKNLATASALETDARIGRIVRVLMHYPTVVISGTKLAQEIGTTRSEVWRLVQQLRDLGVEIAGHPASGYQLTSVPDLLLPELLEPLARGTIFGEHIRHFYRAGSTNTLALEAAAGGAPEGSVFLAEQQTAGRGRGSNQWHSAESTGIYCSVILRPSLPPGEILALSLAAGLAVQSAVQQVDPSVTADLKWPNDLLISGKKFCGILTEMSAEATRVRHIVVGIGINVNQAQFPGELAQTATSLRLASGTEWSRVKLCATLLKSLDQEYRSLLQTRDAHAEILRRFEEGSSSVRGRKVRVEENGGFEGITEGLDQRGFLRVRNGDELRIVYTGTVRLKQ
jgi:BirA family transcriptional regulator, biotin operon repressor / biotin---[acetyl-CoA-carboxylase] ligase